MADITAVADMTSTEVAPDHNPGMGTATIEAAQGDPIQHIEDTVVGLTVIHPSSYTTDLPPTTVHQVTALRTAVDHFHTHPTDLQNITHTQKDHIVQDLTPIRESKNHTLKGIEKAR